jgi:hypothetical protein
MSRTSRVPGVPHPFNTKYVGHISSQSFVDPIKSLVMETNLQIQRIENQLDLCLGGLEDVARGILRPPPQSLTISTGQYASA